MPRRATFVAVLCAAVLRGVAIAEPSPGGADSLRTVAPAASDSRPLPIRPVLSLPMVEVSAPRPQSDSLLRAAPGFAQGYDVSRARGRALMVGDLLAGAVGVHVRQFGGVGSFATASIRGASPAQVAVYLDGVPLHQAQYGVVDLADLPVEALDRVEVFRGAAPLTLESPGGGAINLVSAEARGRWARVGSGGGSFGTKRADLGGGWRAARWSLLAVGRWLESRGDFRYLDDNATPFNPGDDTTATRANNWARMLGLTGRASVDLGPLRVALTHDHQGKRQGVPGIGANPALSTGLATDRDLTHLTLARAGTGGALAGATLRLFGAWHRDRFSDLDGKLTGVRQASDNRTDHLGTAAVVPLGLPWGQHLTASGEAEREIYRPALVLPAPRDLADSRRTSLTWGLEDRWRLPFGVVLMTSFTRGETRDSFPAGPAYPGALPSPAVSRVTILERPVVSLTVDLAGGFALKASAARLARAPTLEELFGNRAGVYGNPKALPERVATRDLGLIGRRTWATAQALPAILEFQASAYRSDAKDLLAYIQNSQRSVVAQNISAARLWGVEWDGRLVWRAGFSLNTSWTRQWTRDEGAVSYWHGRELPSRPRDEGAAQFSYGRPRWRAFYDFHYVAPNWLDRANTERAAARALHDVGTAVRFPFTAVEVTAECRNLGDARVQDFAGYPLPGRSYYFGINTQLHRKEDTP